MKKSILMIILIMTVTLMLAGCSSVPKEEEIQQDLESFSDKAFLDDGEKIDSLTIEKRDTDKKNKSDLVWCTIVTEKDDVSYEKEVTLSYYLYDKTGWTLEDYKVADQGKWNIIPLSGVKEADLRSNLVGKTITVDNQAWEILDSEISQLTIKSQNTDLEKKTDQITMDIVLDGEIESVSGTLVADYTFDKAWNLSSLSEKYSLRPEVKEDKNGYQAVEVSTSASAGADAHLIVKLYGCSGIDAAIGVHGSVEGTVKLASTTESVGDIGQLDMEIGPDISGTLVAKVPVFASGLIEQPLFSVKLPSFWESHWPTEEEKQDMLNTEEQSTQDASAGDEVLTAPDSHHQEDSQNGLYVTKWGQVNQVKYPTFQFKIPKGWKITTEEIEDTSNLVRERVEMENNEGLTVEYWDFSDDLGMHGHMAAWSEITKAADSEFEPGIPEGTDEDYSYIGKMMVAKIHVTKQWQEPIDEDWKPTDWTFYAVLPESFAKEIVFAGLSGMLETFSFQYPHYHVFMASAPDGTFTKEQEAEVIDILKSFTTTGSIY